MTGGEALTLGVGTAACLAIILYLAVIIYSSGID